MKLAFACPFYGNTPPLVNDSFRANIINASELGHQWIDDYSTSGTQHRNACEAIAFKAAHDPRIDAVFWTEHDVILPPLAAVRLAETLEATPEADAVLGIAFKRCEPYNPMIAHLSKNMHPRFHLTREQYEEMKKSDEYNVRRAASLVPYEEMKEKTLLSISTVDSTGAPFEIDSGSMCCWMGRQSLFERTKDVSDLFAIDKHGLFSIDNAFFLRLRERGMRLFCDPRVLCGHLGDQEIIDAEKWHKYTMKRLEQADIKRQEKIREEKGLEPRIYGELTRLANKNKTDKGTLDHQLDSGWSGWTHNYCDFYQAMLEPIRLTAESVLEIGVWHGGSLRMWRDYFPHAQVWGIDNDLSNSKLTEEDLWPHGRISVVEGNAADRDFLGKFMKQFDDAFDLIVDDGSHFMQDQQISLGFLFKYVRPGGWYIVEDVHTSFLRGIAQGEAYNNFGVNADGSNVTIKMIEDLANGKPVQSEYLTDEERAYLDANVVECRIYGQKSMTAMIRKRG